MAGSYTKGPNSTGASIMHVKNDFKISKILKSTILDKSSKKLNAFALNLQSNLILKWIRQGKAKGNLV